MATYQIYNDNESVRIIEGGVSHTIDKDYSIFVMGNIVNIYFVDKDSPTWSIDYAQVTEPSVSSAEGLRIALESYKVKLIDDVTDNNSIYQINLLEQILEELRINNILLKKIYQ